MQKSKLALAELALETALRARQRVYGLSPDKAKQVEAVDVLGRLRLTGQITEPQFEAGKRYEEKRADYHRVILARPVPSAGDLQRQPGFDGSDGTGPAYQAWCRQVTSDFRAMRKALMECGDPLASMVLDGIMDGMEMFQFIGTLRVALNAVGRVANQRARAA